MFNPFAAASPPPAEPFPTALTHPLLPWQRLGAHALAPHGGHVIFAVVPHVSGAQKIYAYSERTGETYEKVCTRPAMIRTYLIDFARQHG